VRTLLTFFVAITSLAMVLAWIVVISLVLHALGRRWAVGPGRSRWSALGNASLHVLASLPTLAVLVLAALVARSRSATGAWPELHYFGLDECPSGASAFFHASAFPVHQSCVHWLWLAALVSPFFVAPSQAFLVGLGEGVHRGLLAAYALSWLMWLCLAYADPGGFASWAGLR
jgi:hypothetical protein